MKTRQPLLKISKIDQSSQRKGARRLTKTKRLRMKMTQMKIEDYAIRELRESAPGPDTTDVPRLRQQANGAE
jgi:hypothetical protein